MASNHSKTEGVKLVRESLSQRMSSYDRLPPALRQFIDDCPIEQSPSMMLRVWLASGMDTQYTLRGFQLGQESKFPGYRPLRRRPKFTAPRGAIVRG